MNNQFISKEIKETVANQLNKTSVGTTESHEVGLELLMKVAQMHNERYGFVPVKWQEAIDFGLAGYEDSYDYPEVA